MAKKDTFLLVSLQEDKAKEVAQIITNKTCRKMLDFLAGSLDATETQISKALNLPISTVHYNLEALKKAKLVESEEFHYSTKGKEVAHYKLANKYIIIAPKSTHGIKSKLRSILALGIFTAAAAFFINVFSKGLHKVSTFTRTWNYGAVAEEAASGTAGTASVEGAMAGVEALEEVAQEVAPTALQKVAEAGLETFTYSTNDATADLVLAGTNGTQIMSETVQTVTQPSIWQNPVFWFIIGVVFAIGLYFLIEHIRKKRSK